MLMGDAMLSSLFRKEAFSSKMKIQDGVSARRESGAEMGGDFRVFRDYLGLANLVIPGGFQPRFEADLDDFVLYRRESLLLDLTFLETQHRHRMNSLDSDALSETSSCSRSDSESFDSLSQEMLPTFGRINTSPILESSLHSLDPVLANRKASTARPFDLPQQQQQQQSKDGRRNASKASVCVFCRNNGESREFYSSHTLKDNEGNTACPILRAYTCPLCKANGDHSHTIKYCPKYTPKQKVEKPFGLI